MSKVSVETVLNGSTAERVVDRRQSQRGELIVRVDYATVDELFSEFTRDVHEGGLFIETDSPEEPGESVKLLIRLPKLEHSLELEGRVAWVCEGGEVDFPPGMGVEFQNLPDAARKIINEVVRELKTPNLS